MEWVSKLFDIAKLPTKIVCLVAVVSGLILFVPGELQTKIHTAELVARHGSILGLAFLSSAGLVILNLIIWVLKLARRKYLEAKRCYRLCRALESLTMAEQAVLREYLIQGKDSLLLPFDEATVALLIRKGILCQAGQIAQQSLAGVLIPLALTEPTRRLLRSEHVCMPESPTDSQWKEIMKSRPVYMREINRIEQDRSGLGW